MPANMKNINMHMKRGHGGPLACADPDMVKLDIQDKKGMEILNVKVLCEEFEHILEYEIFVDRISYCRIGYDKKSKEYDIKYNEHFKAGE